MAWELSKFGKRLCLGSGIGETMDDLGAALAGGDRFLMLGGGQPAHIPAVETIWHQQMQRILDTPGQLQNVLGKYDAPAGNAVFRQSLASLFQNQFGWKIGPENIAITAGGQTAFFFMFNALAGQMEDGSSKHILLPLVPEYFGYADQSVSADIFRAVKPRIEMLDDHTFKYRVDFDALTVDDQTAAICVSRPTNPSGNVLTDQEVARLASLASDHGIPLIVDNAYGSPFPGAIYGDAQTTWNDDIILTFSLSKLGLPGTRTGIVIGNPEIIEAISSMTSIVGLANNNIGQAVVGDLVRTGEILRISDEVVRPFYQQKSIEAVEIAHRSFDPGLPYRIHRCEGAFFLWIWMEGLPIPTSELYRRLKARGVLVIPGNYFFFGIDDDDWSHRNECIRVSFTMPEATVTEGLQIIADEVAKAYRE